LIVAVFETSASTVRSSSSSSSSSSAIHIFGPVACYGLVPKYEGYQRVSYITIAIPTTQLYGARSCAHDSYSADQGILRL
jgi:hypothetical protein